MRTFIILIILATALLIFSINYEQPVSSYPLGEADMGTGECDEANCNI